jgi:hypothetical protein
MKAFITVVTLSLSPVAAVAAQPVDNYANRAIVSGHYDVAETTLMQRLSVAPADQPALINLGHVYRHTNRAAAANAAYRRVLARSNVRLTAVDGRPVWSHDVARAGLGGTVELAMR